MKHFFLALLFLFFAGEAISQCVTLNVTTQNVSCFNGNDGEITVEVLTGVPNFTYELYLFRPGFGSNLMGQVNTSATSVTFTKGNGTLSPLFDVLGIRANSIITPPGSSYRISVAASGTSGDPFCETLDVTGIIITQPTQLTATLGTVIPACAPGTGEINITAAGGTQLGGGPPNYIYNWSGPTAIANTEEDPTGLDEGTYSVTVEDQNGCTASINNIVVAGKPVTSAITGDNEVCESEAGIPYSVTATPGSVYTWTISNGTQAGGGTTNSITVDWDVTDPGDVMVEEENSAGCIGDPVNLAVTINPLPVTSAIAGDADVCANQAGVAYSVALNAGSTYAWTITNGAQASGGSSNSITVNWGATDPGDVQVIETSADGCAGVPVNLAVTIFALPTTSPITGDNDVCANETGLTYSVVDTPGSTYAWTITNGNQVSGTNTNSITVDWSATSPGTVQVIETNADGCPGAPVTLSVTINPTPVTGVITGDNSVCENETGVPYSVPFTAGSTYAWSISNGTQATGGSSNSITVDWDVTSPGEVQVIKTSAAGCDGPPVTLAVTINPTPVTGAITGSSVVCANETGVSYSVPITAGSTYAWTIINGAQASGGSTNSITVNWGATDPGDVEVVETSIDGCQGAPVNLNVTIQALPVVNAPLSSLCIGETMNLTPNTGGTWMSSSASVATVDNAGLVTAVSAGSVTFTFTETISGCSATTGAVTVNPDNTVGAPSSTPTLCINTALTNITHSTTGATGIGAATGLPAGVSAAWAGNVITISGTPTASGIFNYSIPLTGGCGSVDATGTITVNPNNTVGGPSATPTLCINTALTNITHSTTGATGIGPATGLPAGVSAAWAGNVITISGTPTAIGIFNYSIPLTGGCSSINATGTITVNPDNTVGGPSSTPTLCTNTALTDITHSTTGATGIGAATGLPTGVSAVWAADVITISGTPTASGTFNYSIPLTGGCGSVNATGTIIVTPGNTVGGPSTTPTLCINTVLTNITHSTTGATGIGAATGLPAGVSAAWAGNVITISGTPTASGIFNYSIPLTGGCGSVNATGTITVNLNNTVSGPSSTPTLCINTVLTNITHSTTGATGIGAATGLPAGVSAAWAGNVITISGTPTASGIFNYSIPLTGGCSSINATGTITVNPDNTVGGPSSTPTLCTNTALTDITHSTTGAAGIGAATGLPNGVSASWAADVITISGTPTEDGVFGYSIPLTGGCGSVNATGTITVNLNNTVGAPSSTPTLCINTALTNITHSTTGATGIGAATGLPNGVSASWAADVITISGTPTEDGVFGYSIPLTGGCGSVDATGTITVNELPTASISGTTSVCQDGVSPDVTFTGAGGNLEYTFTYNINGGSNQVVTTSGGNSVTVAAPTSVDGIFIYNLVSVADGNSCGQAQPGSATITVNLLPSASIAYASPLCNIGTATVTQSGQIGGIYSSTTGLIINPGTGEIDLAASTAGTYTVTYTFTDGVCPNTTTADVTIQAAPSASLSGTANICVGQSTILSLNLTGGGPWDVVYTDGNSNFPINGIASNPHALTVIPIISTTYSLVSVSNAACGSGSVSGTADVTVTSIGGNPATAGVETWLAYVYDDSSTPGTYDFNAAKYRGVLNENDLLNLRPGSVTYDASTDAFNMPLSNAFPVQGPSVCGSYLNFYSIRLRMSKTFTQGVYTFKVGSDDGVRIIVDGINRPLTQTSGGAPVTPWGLHGYTEFETDGICLSAGAHNIVIEYFEQSGSSRLMFEYEQIGAPVVATPVSACVNSAAPTLTANSPGATGYRWYSDSGLTTQVASTQNYVPAGPELDMATAGQTTFYVVGVYSCGQTPASPVVVDVISSATLTANASPYQICQSASPLDLTTVVTASPSGGTIVFAGTGVVGNDFDASQAVGTYTLTANYSTGSCSAPPLTFDVEIINNAVVTTPASATDVCELAIVDLLPLVSAAPTGGAFTFFNVTGGPVVPIAGTQFDPSGLSGVVTIRADYAAGTCTDSKTFDLNIIAAPSLTTVNTIVCPNGGNLDLLTLVSGNPTGGSFTFTGSPAIAGNFLDPIALGGTTVNINVTYDIGSSCTVSSVTPIVVTVRSSSDPLCGPGGCTLIPTLSKTDATCTGLSDGTITVAGVFGGTGPYEFSVDNGVNFQPIAAFPATTSGLPGGNYSVIVRDTPGCLSSAISIIIGNLNTISGTVVKTDVSCSGGDGSIQITNPTGGSGPYQFSINGGTDFLASNSFTSLGVGSYNVVIRDNGGCISGTLPVGIASPTNCTGGGGTGTCATVVIVPKPSPATCTNSDGRIIFSIKPFVPAVNNTGVRISIDGVSPTNQSILRTNFNDSTFLNLPIGTYDYEIEYGDAACVKTGQVTIDRSGTIGVPVVTNPVDPTCFGALTGAATLDVPGETGNQLEWSLDGTIWNSFIAGNQVVGIPAGTTVLSVRRDANDPCASGAVVTLAAPTELSATLTSTNASCTNNDGSIVVNNLAGGTGPYSFELNGVPMALPANNTLTGLRADTYNLVAIDALGCVKPLNPVVVSFPGFVNHTTPVVTPPDCTGAGANGVVQFQITDTGSFEFGITNDPVAEPATYSNTGNNNVIVPGLSNGTYYIWLKPGGTGGQCATKLAPVSVTGVYPVTVEAATSDIGCFGDKTSVVISNVAGAPGIDYAYTLTNTIDNTTLTGNISFTQSLSDFSIPDVGPGSYSLLIAQDQSTIVSTCTTPVRSPALTFEINAPSKALDTLFVVKAISLPDLPTGSALIGVDPSGKEPYEVRIELMEPLFPSQAFVADWTQVDLNNLNLKFERTFTNLYAGIYEIRLRDAAGCEKSYAMTIKVDTSLAIPNIFTPNGDGVNDIFFIRNLPPDAAIVITNRWGKEVFRSGAYQNDWAGGDAADGVYYFKLTMPGESVTGWVEIVRGN